MGCLPLVLPGSPLGIKPCAWFGRAIERNTFGSQALPVMLPLLPILISRQRQAIAAQAQMGADIEMQPAEFNSRLQQELRRFGTPAIGQ